MTAPDDDRPFEPGDRIASTREWWGSRRTYTVLDPAFTDHGKLRLRRDEEGTELTTWWVRPSALPRRWRPIGPPVPMYVLVERGDAVAANRK